MNLIRLACLTLIALPLAAGCGKDDATDKQREFALTAAAARGNLDHVRQLLTQGIDTEGWGEEGMTPLCAAAANGHTGVVQLLAAHGANLDARSGGMLYTALQTAVANGHMATAKALVECGASIEDACNPLPVAAEAADLAAVEFFLDLGADPNQGALHAAASAGRVEIVEYLIAAGADLMSVDSEGRTALACAVPHYEYGSWFAEGHPEAARALIEAGAIPTLTQAAYLGDLETLQQLIEAGADVDATDAGSPTALYLAAREGYLDIARLLVGSGADINAAEEKDHYTPLHIAIAQGHTEVAQFLIAAGADLNARSYHNRPVGQAVEEDQPDVVAAMIAAGEPMTVRLAAYLGNVAELERLAGSGAALDDEFNRPLILASRHGHVDAVQYLIDHGANPNAPGSLGQTPLHHAAEANQAEVIALLVARGADVDMTTSQWQRRTPLEVAIDANSTEALQQLLLAGADPDARGYRGQTPLNRAASDGCANMVEVLLASGADIDATDREGDCPLHRALASGHNDTARVLIAHGADVNAKGQAGRTPLHVAARAGDLAMVRLLIDGGSDVNAPDVGNVTPLHVAAERDHVEVAEALIAAGANVNATDSRLFTPLMAAVAAKNGRAAAAPALIAAGASVNIQNDGGWTPLHYAARRGLLDTVSLLLAHGADAGLETKLGQTAAELARDADYDDIAHTLRRSM